MPYNVKKRRRNPSNPNKIKYFNWTSENIPFMSFGKREYTLKFIAPRTQHSVTIKGRIIPENPDIELGFVEKPPVETDDIA